MKPIMYYKKYIFLILVIYLAFCAVDYYNYISASRFTGESIEFCDPVLGDDNDAIFEDRCTLYFFGSVTYIGDEICCTCQLCASDSECLGSSLGCTHDSMGTYDSDIMYPDHHGCIFMKDY